ncbi:hypothetical protein KM043_011522 [Ampulex compressa]|nr:hypothetical protein KM043_011522 [Ampulex compressa]
MRGASWRGWGGAETRARRVVQLEEPGTIECENSISPVLQSFRVRASFPQAFPPTVFFAFVQSHFHLAAPSAALLSLRRAQRFSAARACPTRESVLRLDYCGEWSLRMRGGDGRSN